MNQNGTLYIKDVETLLNLTNDQKEQKNQDLMNIVQMYLNDNEQATYEQIAEALGSPEHMAAELMYDITEVEKYQARENQKKVYTAVAAVCLAVAIGACAAVAYFIQNPYTEEITTVIDYTESLPSYWDYAVKYGINYEYDEKGIIVRATDNDGNEIAVDEKGIPLDKEKYFIEEEEK
ncbi:MAG: hypothetical protein Q4D42_00350 [Eubacteriales bacterium]|nr:hypothetical protein [Eubacteriales bacterium]